MQLKIRILWKLINIAKEHVFVQQQQQILLEAKNVSDNVTINPEMISSSSRFAVYNALEVIMNELLHKQCGYKTIALAKD